MKAFFIDVTKKEVTEIDIENKLPAFYAKIGCRLIDTVPLGENQLLILDDEGRLKQERVGCFRFEGQGKNVIPFFGNALMVNDGEEDWTDIDYPLEVVRENITFFDMRPSDFPPPRFRVITFE